MCYNSNLYSYKRACRSICRWYCYLYNFCLQWRNCSGYASLIKDDIPEGLEYVKDSEINKKFNWKLLDENNKETDDVKKAKYIVSDYLSKENGDDNILMLLMEKN